MARGEKNNLVLQVGEHTSLCGKNETLSLAWCHPMLLVCFLCFKFRTNSNSHLSNKPASSTMASTNRTVMLNSERHNSDPNSQRHNSGPKSGKHSSDPNSESHNSDPNSERHNSDSRSGKGSKAITSSWECHAAHRINMSSEFECKTSWEQ